MALFKIENTPLRFIFFCGRKSFSIPKRLNINTYFNYDIPLKTIKKKFGKEKIRVGFLVNEQAKWQYQSVYDEFEKRVEFEPIILVTQMTRAHYGTPHYYKSLDDCYRFFLNLGLRVEITYNIKNKSYIPISNFKIDILFYQQPWEIPDIYSPLYLSKFILTCYTTYGMDLTWYNLGYIKNFHGVIWKIFVENNFVIKYFEKITKSNIKNCYPVGYSKLDEYYKEIPEKIINKKIIYWIFKPHPRFKTAII